MEGEGEGKERGRRGEGGRRVEDVEVGWEWLCGCVERVRGREGERERREEVVVRT